MGQQIMDIDTVGFSPSAVGNYFDFYVNDTFYLLAPPYYYNFYATYLRKSLLAFDGYLPSWHQPEKGLVPQRMLQSVARGLNNMIFAHGIDFCGDHEEYVFATKWAKKARLYKTLKLAHFFAIAGGTSLLKINRADSDLYWTAHRIDNYFADTDANGKIVRVRVYIDAIQNTTDHKDDHYGILEERFFDEEGHAKVKACVYKGSGTLQTATMARPVAENSNDKNCGGHRVNWSELPQDVKTFIKTHYPSVIIDKEQYLPFANSLGCVQLQFTDDLPQVPNSRFGQPIGDTLWTENFQYDQMKYFEKNEVHLARARALIAESMWNKDDPLFAENALDETYFQKVNSIGDDNDKVTPLQFLLRGMDIKTQKENIFKDIAFKLQISASSVATFLSEGAGARTATEIVSERTKTDTWIDGQIRLNKPEIDELLKITMLYYNQGAVEIVFKTEDQSSFLELVKIWGDQLSAGNITPELFVRKVHKDLTEEQQQAEIEALKIQRQLKANQTIAVTQSMAK